MKYILPTLLFSQIVAAKPILITAPELKYSESEARLRSLEGTAYSDHIILKLRQHAHDKGLLHLAARLREAELGQNQEKIFNICTQAYGLRHNADWEPADRDFIQHCLQKLKLMSSDKRKQQSLKIEASAFSKAALKPVSIPKFIVKKYKWVLINGKAFLTQHRVVGLPRSFFRMTLVSDQYEAVTKIINTEQFLRWSQRPVALVSGDCQSGYRYESRHLDSINIRKTLVAAKDCKIELISSHPIQKDYVKPKGNSFKVPKWAWWVAGGVLGYAVFEKNQDSHKSSTPSSKRGF